MTATQFEDAVCGAEARSRLLLPSVVAGLILFASTLLLAVRLSKSPADD
jgi:hypothetical protein